MNNSTKSEFLPSVVLIKRANDFLDDLAASPTSDEEILKKIEEFKNQMLMLDFNAPFRAVLQKTYSEVEENSVLNSLDQKKQKNYIIYLASLKKFTLNRVAVAYAAHKFKNSLERFGYNYLVEFLPLGGEYRQKLSDIYALEAYLHLQEIFKPMQIEQYSKNINFQKNYKIVTKKKVIFKSHSSKVALFSAIALFASKKAQKEVDETATEKINLYNSILKSCGFIADILPSNFENFPFLLEKLKQTNLLYHSKEKFYLEPELEARLNKRRMEKKNKAVFYACQILFDLLFDYYLTTNSSSREGGQLFYSITPTPAKEHLEVFDLLYQEQKFKPSAFLEEKFILEQKNIPLNPKIVGVAFLYLKTGLALEELSKRYKIKEEEIKEAVEILQHLTQREDSKLSLFLEGLKSGSDADLEGKERRDFK
ncbi:MAG: DUF530 family protein [Candidatus Micrarchaeota archaeon]|nr:DUF530 family protein [Candidatus Micrarchaeota archaeon]